VLVNHREKLPSFPLHCNDLHGTGALKWSGSEAIRRFFSSRQPTPGTPVHVWQNNQTELHLRAVRRQLIV